MPKSKSTKKKKVAVGGRGKQRKDNPKKKNTKYA